MNHIVKYLFITLLYANSTAILSVNTRSPKQRAHLNDLPSNALQPFTTNTHDTDKYNKKHRAPQHKVSVTSVTNTTKQTVSPLCELEQFIQTIEMNYKHLHNPDLQTPLVTRVLNTGTSCRSILSAFCQHLKITACFTNTVGYYKTKHDFAAAILNCEEPDKKYNELKRRLRTYQETGTLDQHPGFAMLMRSMNKRNVAK